MWLSLHHAYEGHILAKRWECKKGGSACLLADWSVSTQTSGPVFLRVIPKKQQNLPFLAQSMKLSVCFGWGGVMKEMLEVDSGEGEHWYKK